MSDTDTVITPDVSTEDTEDTPAVVEVPEVDLTTENGIALALAGTDDSGVAEENLPALLAVVGKVQAGAGKLAEEAGKLLRRRKALAAAFVEMARLVTLPSGLPDWGGSTSGFKLLFDQQIEAALANETLTGKDSKIGKQESKNLRNSIRQHVKRTYLDPAIRAYLMEVTETKTDDDGNTVTLAGLPWSMTPESPAFITALKKEYARNDLTPPTRYLSPEEKQARSDGGPGPGPEDPAEVIRKMVAGSAQLAPQYAAAEILQAMTGLVGKITDLKSGEAFDRVRTSAYLARVQDLSEYAVRYIDGRAKTPEEEGILDAFWSKEDTENLA